jgi:sphinganine-1-phosphate aldolase
MKTIRKSLPEKGLAASDLISEMKTAKSADASWRNGKMFGYIYHPGDEEARVLEETYAMFCCENALNPSLFSSLRKFENETVAIVADLLHAPSDAAASLTSCGTESILMTVKTARDKARADHPRIVKPEILLPESAHPAFMKAAHYFDVKAVHIPVRSDKRADAEAMEKKISENTILLIGSAPCFPHGVIDPVAEIGRLALKYNIPFHVDACMGGMLLPFAEKLGYAIPLFDFRVPGVTSISADMHKYGYSPKGASVIIYASHEIRKYQFFVYTEWSGGIYASPTALGTRCGGPIAAAWASLMHLGNEGYMKRAGVVMETSRRLQAGINAIPGLYVVSNPEISVFAFTSDVYDIFAIGDELSLTGWHLDRIQFPNSLHVTVSYHNAAQSDNFLRDLRSAVKKVASGKIRSISSHFLVSFVKGLSRVLPVKWFHSLSSAASASTGRDTGSKPHGSAAMYGITAAIDNRENVHEMVLEVIDRLYTI